MRRSKSLESKTSTFRLPAISWPVVASLTVAIAVSIVPGCEERALETKGSMKEIVEKSSRPLVETNLPIDGSTAVAGEPTHLQPILPGVDETGWEMTWADPLRLPHTDDPAVDQLSVAQGMLDAGRYADAVETFRKAVFDTESYESFYGLGRAARLAGDADLAIEALAKAADIDPEAAEPLIMAARLSLSEQDTRMGLVYVRRARERDSHRPDVHNVEGRLWMARQEYHRAIECFDRAIEADQGFAWAWNNKGYVQLLMGSYEDAIDSLEIAVSLSPETAYMHNNLGLAYEKAGRPSRALSSFSEALHLRPKYVNAIVNLDRMAKQQTALAEAEAEATSDGPRVFPDDSLEFVPGG